MTDDVLLQSLVVDVRAAMTAASAILDGIPEDPAEGPRHRLEAARRAVRRLLEFTAEPDWGVRQTIIAFISEARNALVPALIVLEPLLHIAPVAEARVVLTRFLETIAEYSNETFQWSSQ